jgi:ferredoxin
MPWVNQDLCTGCGTCVEECPVEAISLDEQDLARIDEQECIRCGKCHDACPVEAVRHDGERIPQDVEGNLQWVNALKARFETDEEKQELVGRMVRYFTKERKVAEQTIERLHAL